MKRKTIRQGEVYMVDLSFGAVGHEQNGVRPCIIVSNNIRNDNSSNVFVFPITHATNKKYQPCHYRLLKKEYDFFTYNVNTVLCEEGRSISKKRLERRLGCISKKDIEKILKTKEYVFIEKE